MAIVYDLDPALITDGVDGQGWSGVVNGVEYSSETTPPLFQEGTPNYLFFQGGTYGLLRSEELPEAVGQWSMHLVFRGTAEFCDMYVELTQVAGGVTAGVYVSLMNISVSLGDDGASHEIEAGEICVLSVNSEGAVLLNGSTVGALPSVTSGFSYLMAEGTDAEVYRVVVSDSVSSSFVQDAEAMVSLYNSGPEVSWTAAADGGSPVTGFVARFLVGGQVVEKTAAAEATSIEGPPGATAVQVFAVNDVGWSSPAEKVL